MYSFLLLAAFKPACDYIIKQVTDNIKQDRNLAYDELAEKLSKQTNDEQTVKLKILDNLAEKLSKHTNDDVESSLTALLKLAEKLSKQADDLSGSLCYNNKQLLAKLEELLSKHNKKSSLKQSHLPSLLRGAIELDGSSPVYTNSVQLLCKDVAEVRKLVLESSRKNLEDIDQVKVSIGEHTNKVKTYIDDRIEKVGKQVMENRTAGQLDAADIRNTLLENRTVAHADAISLHDEHVQMHNKSSITALRR